jgi:hypothetical protein
VVFTPVGAEGYKYVLGRYHGFESRHPLQIIF